MRQRHSVRSSVRALALPSLAALAMLVAPGARALLAQQPAPQGAPAAAGSVSAAELRDALLLEQASLQTLALPAAPHPGEPLVVRVQLAGAPRDLVLLPHSVRAGSFQLLVQGADGRITAQVPAPPATYRGHVVGVPGSIVAASLLEGQLHAIVRLDPVRAILGIQPATVADPAAPHALHVVYDSSDAHGPEMSCGTTDVPAPADARTGAGPGGGGTGGGSGPGDAGPGDAAGPGDVVCEIACDADFEYYGKNGSSVTNTMNDIENVINAVEAIYDADVGVLYDITTILVRTSEPDPYTTNSPGSLLNQFALHWSSQQSAIHRDIAHLFTGRNLDGSTIGIAQLSVICSQGSGFGLSQSKYTSNFAYRTALTAHELGHNWSAGHCDGESACSIMCSGLGGCSGNISSFNTSSKNAINNKKNAAACLDDAVPPPPPVLASLAPTTVQAVGGTTVTVNGSGFLKVSEVQVGGISLGEGAFLVQTDGQLTFLAPQPLALGATPVTLVNAGGSSAPKTLTYVETSPPQLAAYAFTVTGFDFPWEFYAGANDTAALLIGLSPATFTYQGQPILATNLILTMQPLSAVGLGGMSLTLPASAAGATFYSQLVTIDGAEVQSSPVISTWVVL
jgi:hypothetical protein